MLSFLAFAFVSETIATTVGFGASTILLPLALFYFDFKTALTLVAFFHLFGSLGRFSFFRHSLNREILIKFGLPSVFLSLLGATLANSLTQTTFKGLLGIFLILYGAVSLINDRFQVKPNAKNLILGGGISGFIAGLIGTGGALRATFLSAFKHDKATYLATTAALSLAVDLTRIPIYLNQSFLSGNMYFYIPILFVLAIAATYVGKQIVRFIPAKLFEKLVLLAIITAGIWFGYSWLFS